MNVHTPERQPGESREAYRNRQRLSRAHTRRITCRGLSGGVSSREQLRDAKRANGTLRGTYGLGLLQPQRKRNQARMEMLHNLHDKHGAFTLTGGRATFVGFNPGPDWFPVAAASGPEGLETTARRVWLAGISAQRGY